MDFPNIMSATTRNIQELLLGDTNAVSYNTGTIASDCKTAHKATNGFNHGLGHGIQHNEPVAIDIMPISDCDVKPIVIYPEDSDFNSAIEIKPVEPVEVKPVEVKPVEVKPVEVKPVETKLEGCDLYFEEKAIGTHGSHVCFDSDRNLDQAVIGGNTINIEVNYVDEQSVKDEKIREDSENVSFELERFGSSEVIQTFTDFTKVDYTVDGSFPNINTSGVLLVKCEDTSEQFVTPADNENGVSNRMNIQEDRSYDVQMKNESSQLVSIDEVPKGKPEEEKVDKRQKRALNLLHSSSWKKRRGNLTCHVCEKQFKSMKYLTVHKKYHKTKNPVICRICGLRYEDLRTLKMHVRCHALEFYHPCGLCERFFSTAKELKEHASKHHNDTFEKTKSKCYQICKICGERVATRCLKSHESKHYKEDYLKSRRRKRKEHHECSKCGKLYTHSNGRQSLALHRCYINAEPHKVKCEVCGKAFAPSVMESHVTLHGGKITDVCQLCGKGFTHHRFLDLHYLRVHPKEKCHPCNECDRMFANKGVLRRHQKMHSKDRPYPCNICNTRFEHKNTFDIHMQGHTEGRRPVGRPRKDEQF